MEKSTLARSKELIEKYEPRMRATLIRFGLSADHPCFDDAFQDLCLNMHEYICRNPDLTNADFTMRYPGYARRLAESYQNKIAEMPYEYTELYNSGAVDTSVPKIENVENVMMLERAFRVLSDREKNIIECRFFDNMSLPEIGRKFNITNERVRQLEAKALRKMCKELGFDRAKMWFDAEQNKQSTVDTTRIDDDLDR